LEVEVLYSPGKGKTNTNDKQQIIDCLRQHGAEDIEIAKGQWEKGEWRDFDSVASPQLVD
jgi:hypothetical protein